MSGDTYFLGKPYEPNGIIKSEIEYILLLRKPGGHRKPTEEQRRLSRISKDDYQSDEVWGRPNRYPPRASSALIGCRGCLRPTLPPQRPRL